MKNPLLDLKFLKQLDLCQHKEVYAKIILLNFNEEPKYEIQGRITSGSINIDGASAIRRTCSLTLTTQQGVIESNYWGLENKFKLEVGIKNTIDPQYPEIIWFKQGLYIITSLSETLSTNAHNINISGKDKMCLLNGEVGGNFTSNSIDFGQLEEEDWTGGYIKTYVTQEKYEKNKYYIETDNGYELSNLNFNSNQIYYEKELMITLTPLPIFEIISNLLRNYGKELPHNIVINDIEDYGLELLEYRGDKPLYLIKNVESGIITNMTFNGNQGGYFSNSNCTNPIKLNEITDYDYLITQVDTVGPTIIYAPIGKVVERYTVIKIEYGNTAGYRKTDLTYPGELVANLGETIVTILDKIKSTFSNFEYFYDIDGRFIFQKKKYSSNISWNPLHSDDNGLVYSNNTMYDSDIAYSFEGNNQVTNISYQPNISNIKNDFSIWGKRTSVSGMELPIHLRYAIQDKPYYYKKIDLNEYNQSVVYYTEQCPDELLNNTDDNRLYDWREIIYQMALDYFKHYHSLKDFLVIVSNNNPMYPTGLTGYEDFYTDMQAFWRNLYNPNETASEQYDYGTHWNKAVMEYPETLDFWIDFLDTNSEYGKYSISRIGSRTKTVNNDKIKAVYFREVPQILIITDEEYDELIENSGKFLELQGYTYIRIPENFKQYFSISGQGLNAWDEFNNLLYQHTNYTERITLTTFPIYYLQPNNKILINVNENKINGEYVIDKITVPLGYNGTGSIQANKVIKRIY